MFVSFHLVVLLVHDYLTPEWKKPVRDITQEIVATMLEAREAAKIDKGCSRGEHKKAFHISLKLKTKCLKAHFGNRFHFCSLLGKCGMHSFVLHVICFCFLLSHVISLSFLLSHVILHTSTLHI